MSILPERAYQPRPPRRGRNTAAFIAAFVVLAVLAGVGLFLFKKLLGTSEKLAAEVCIATYQNSTAQLSHEQMHYAALIAGMAVQKELGTRGAIVGLATAMQESSLRNLNYGDRDSLGLFQQRPSQGWGTEDQLQDPYYSSARFYKELVKFDDWETGDVNDVAQEVQRSGVPDGYRKHVTKATTLAHAFTAGGTVTCVSRDTKPGDIAALATSLEKTFGPAAKPTIQGKELTIVAPDAPTAAMFTAHLGANSAMYGITAIKHGDRAWFMSGVSHAPWSGATPGIGATTVVVTVR